jgi:hypothetical protein
VYGEFVCNICGELHETERAHKEHIRWHENEDNECDICQRRFANHATLKGKLMGSVHTKINCIYPLITYYWTVPLILDHSYLVGKLTSSKIAVTKVSGFQRF